MLSGRAANFNLFASICLRLPLVCIRTLSCLSGSLIPSLPSATKITHVPATPSDGTLVGIALSADGSLLYTAGSGNTVRVHDLRAPVSAGTSAVALSVPGGVPAVSFALNSDDTALAVGTEEEGGNAAVYVAELRAGAKARLLPHLANAHSSYVVELAFAPQRPSVLATGSTDGLVNLVDLHSLALVGSHAEASGSVGWVPPAGTTAPPEAATFDFAGAEEAVVMTLNTDSSVNRLRFFGPQDDFLCGTTHDDSICMWHARPRCEEESEFIARFDSVPAALVAGGGPPCEYLVDSLYQSATRRLYILGGTHSGALHLSHLNMVSEQRGQWLAADGDKSGRRGGGEGKGKEWEGKRESRRSSTI